MSSYGLEPETTKSAGRTIETPSRLYSEDVFFCSNPTLPSIALDFLALETTVIRAYGIMLTPTNTEALPPLGWAMEHDFG